MLRKTLIALTAVAALSMGSSAAVAHGGGHGGWGGRGMAPMHGSWGGRSMAMAPMRGNWSGHPFTRSAVFHNRFHRFHHRNAFFFAAGFAGPGYDSCWVWTSWGWRYVCGYPYGY
jgi:hypothetical protein